MSRKDLRDIEELNRKLYRLTELNLEKAGGTMPVSCDAYLAIARDKRGCFDVANAVALSDRDFQDTAYFQMFDRFRERDGNTSVVDLDSHKPEMIEEKSSNESGIDLSGFGQKREILATFRKSPLFIRMNPVICNNILEENHEPVSGRAGKGLRIKMMKMAYGIASILPAPLKRRIRKLARKLPGGLV